MRTRLPYLLLLVFLLWGAAPRAATAATSPTAHSLTEALNPDGTLRPGVNGSFDARQFRMHTAPDGRPVFRPLGVAGTGDDKWLNGFNLPNGTNGMVNAVVQAGTTVYIAGTFTVAGDAVANGLAKWDGTAWSSLGNNPSNGMQGIGALAVAPNGDLYAGGGFTRAGTVAARNIARWNGTSWNTLGTGTTNGVTGGISALAFAPNGDLYVGGALTQAGSVAVSNIARWNGTTWSALGSGIGGVGGGLGEVRVNALAVTPNGDVYAGGNFSLAGGNTAVCIAKWDGTSWSALGTGQGLYGGFSGVLALAVTPSGNVYAGGDFLKATSAPLTSNNALPYVARWNGTAWSNLGSGSTAGVTGTVYALAVSGTGELYVGGGISRAGSATTNGVAQWNGTVWSVLGTGLASTRDGGFPVLALAVASNGELYAGGGFGLAGNTAVNYLARWNGTTWSGVGQGQGQGINGPLFALAIAPGGDVYAGGNFSQAGGVRANSVARWNGSTWSALGTGLNGFGDGQVYALAVAPNGDVYVGGSFTRAGSVAVQNVARWNGSAWSALGSGSSTRVNALAVTSNGDVYSCALSSSGVPANTIMRWNGTAWSTVGTVSGSSEWASALVAGRNGELYVGGRFTQVGGVTARNLARWDGSTWSSVGTGIGTGITDDVASMTVAGNGHLYVVGSFTQAGGVSARNVAYWNGTTWNALGAGVSSGAATVAVAGTGDVYVSGSFTQAGSVTAFTVARWNGSAWSALGTGLSIGGSSLVLAPSVLVAGAGGQLYAGGRFTTVGDGSKVMSHFGIYDPNSILSVSAPTRARAALYPNPARTEATLRLPAGVPRRPLLLSNPQGRTVRRFPVPVAAETVLDLRGLPAGVYIVHCGQYAQRLLVE